MHPTFAGRMHRYFLIVKLNIPQNQSQIIKIYDISNKTNSCLPSNGYRSYMSLRLVAHSLSPEHSITLHDNVILSGIMHPLQFMIGEISRHVLRYDETQDY